MKKSGFTLIELLVVIAVIGILAGLLFTGILTITHRANEKRIATNARILEAAIMEYRHDTGRWPFPAKAQAVAKTNETTVAGTKTKRIGVTWTLTYGAVNKKTGQIDAGMNNDAVVEMLLNGRVGRKNPTAKVFLDLRPFTTSLEGTERKFPVEETASAYEVWRGGDLSESGAKPRKDGKNIPLLYRRKFFKCPQCGTLQGFPSGSQPRCAAGKDCSGAEEDSNGHTVGCLFTKGDLNDPFNVVEGAVPYKITFDLVNNTCSVGEM